MGDAAKIGASSQVPLTRLDIPAETFERYTDLKELVSQSIGGPPAIALEFDKKVFKKYDPKSMYFSGAKEMMYSSPLEKLADAKINLKPNDPIVKLKTHMLAEVFAQEIKNELEGKCKQNKTLALLQDRIKTLAEDFGYDMGEILLNLKENGPLSEYIDEVVTKVLGDPKLDSKAGVREKLKQAFDKFYSNPDKQNTLSEEIRNFNDNREKKIKFIEKFMVVAQQNKIIEALNGGFYKKACEIYTDMAPKERILLMNQLVKHVSIGSITELSLAVDSAINQKQITEKRPAAFWLELENNCSAMMKQIKTSGGG